MTAMAKDRIDNIAKYRQQPRGRPPKRRTDFSIFVCSSSSKASPDTCVETLSDARDGPCNVATARMNKLEDIEEGPTGCTLVPCSNQPDTGTHLSNGHLTENDSLDANEQANPFPDRNAAMRTQEDDIPRTLEPQVTRCSDLCMTLCPEERDVNLSDSLQNHSKQVLNDKDERDSCGQLLRSPDRRNFSNQQQQSSGVLTLSNSTELEDESSERGRGKRKRKPKLHFDEEPNLPLKSVKKVRRFRIMRHLGLMAPMGSPF